MVKETKHNIQCGDRRWSVYRALNHMRTMGLVFSMDLIETKNKNEKKK